MSTVSAAATVPVLLKSLACTALHHANVFEQTEALLANSSAISAVCSSQETQQQQDHHYKGS
jgi:hypothetical protein